MANKRWGTTRHLTHKAFFVSHPAPLCRPTHMEHGPKLSERWDAVTCKRCLKLRDKDSLSNGDDRRPNVLERITARKKGVILRKVQK